MGLRRRDAEGAKDRVEYMRSRMHFFLGSMVTTNKRSSDFLHFGGFWPDFRVPKSPRTCRNTKTSWRTFDDDAMDIVYVEYVRPGQTGCPGVRLR